MKITPRLALPALLLAFCLGLAIPGCSSEPPSQPSTHSDNDGHNHDSKAPHSDKDGHGHDSKTPHSDDDGHGHASKTPHSDDDGHGHDSKTSAASSTKGR